METIENNSKMINIFTTFLGHQTIPNRTAQDNWDLVNDYNEKKIKNEPKKN